MMQQPAHGGPLVKFTTNSKNPTTQKSSNQNSRKTSQSMSPHTAKALADDRRRRQQMQNMNADLMKDFRSGAGVKNDGKKNMQGVHPISRRITIQDLAKSQGDILISNEDNGVELLNSLGTHMNSSNTITLDKNGPPSNLITSQQSLN